MLSRTIDFLEPASGREPTSFADALQYVAEQAAWAYDEAYADPQHAGPALDRIYTIMRQLRQLSLTNGHIRVAGICEKVCLLIDDAANDLLHSLRDEFRALRRIVIATMQGETGAMIGRA